MKATEYMKLKIKEQKEAIETYENNSAVLLDESIDRQDLPKSLDLNKNKEIALVKAKRYEEASALKKKIDALEEKELKNIRKKKMDKYNKNLKAIKANGVAVIKALGIRIEERRKEHMRQRKMDEVRILDWKKRLQKSVPVLVYLTHKDGQDDSSRPLHLAKPWDRYLSRPVIRFTKGEGRVQPDKSVFDERARNTEESLLLSGSNTNQVHNGTFTAVKMRNKSFCFPGKHDASNFVGNSEHFIINSTAGMYTPAKAAGIKGTDRHLNEFYAFY